MQTFLPHSSFAASARCLDRQRLGKQRVEALTILRILAGHVKGWQNHPAVKMWRGYGVALGLYGLTMCEEWRRRGYRDTCYGKIQIACDPWAKGPAYYPPWIGDEEFHLSHRSNLIRKNPKHWPTVARHAAGPALRLARVRRSEMTVAFNVKMTEGQAMCYRCGRASAKYPVDKRERSGSVVVAAAKVEGWKHRDGMSHRLSGNYFPVCPQCQSSEADEKARIEALEALGITPQAK